VQLVKNITCKILVYIFEVAGGGIGFLLGAGLFWLLLDLFPILGDLPPDDLVYTLVPIVVMGLPILTLIILGMFCGRYLGERVCKRFNPGYEI
jgi:hypothetical protein